MGKAIKKVPCATAKELMEGLSPRNRLWRGNPQFWAFRGHEDDRYKLIPSALRCTPPAKLGYTFAPEVGVQCTNQKQIYAEFKRIQEFYWSVDTQGLLDPINSEILRTPSGWQEIQRKINDQGWPIDYLLPLLALAQHYGVATRLLDWTDKPLVAAYFAGKGAAQNREKRNIETLGIWALNLDWVINTAFPGNGTKFAIYVVTAPRASNPYLHAQGGVFTTENLLNYELCKQVSVRPVNKIVKRRWKKLNSNKSVMVHFTLPSSEVGKLLRLLYQEGISAAALFPGYKGVADSLEERALWDKEKRVSYWLKGGQIAQ